MLPANEDFAYDAFRQRVHFRIQQRYFCTHSEKLRDSLSVLRKWIQGAPAAGLTPSIDAEQLLRNLCLQVFCEVRQVCAFFRANNKPQAFQRGGEFPCQPCCFRTSGIEDSNFLLTNCGCPFSRSSSAIELHDSGPCA